MVRHVVPARPSALRAVFVLIATAIVAVFGVTPAGAAPMRQLGGDGDASAAVTRGGADAGASVSVALPDDAEEIAQAPSPVATPTPARPPLPATLPTVVASFDRPVDSTEPTATRGRAPPR